MKPFPSFSSSASLAILVAFGTSACLGAPAQSTPDDEPASSTVDSLQSCRAGELSLDSDTNTEDTLIDVCSVKLRAVSVAPGAKLTITSPTIEIRDIAVSVQGALHLRGTRAKPTTVRSNGQGFIVYGDLALENADFTLSSDLQWE